MSPLPQSQGRCASTLERIADLQHASWGVIRSLPYSFLLISAPTALHAMMAQWAAALAYGRSSCEALRMGAFRNQQEGTDLGSGSLSRKCGGRPVRLSFLELLIGRGCAPGGWQGQGQPQLVPHVISILFLPVPSRCPGCGSLTDSAVYY